MSTSDQLQRFIFDETDVRGELVGLEKAYQDLVNRHNHPAPVRQLMGEFMAAAALLSATLKFEGTMSLQAKGDGPISLMMAECTDDQDLRAIARYEDQDQWDENNLIGNGQLIITIEPKDGQRYQGIVPLEGDRLADALGYYFEQSEQLETKIWLAVDEHRASGFLLQKLPQQLNKDSDAWDRISHLGSTIREDELLNLPNDQILHRLYHEEKVRVFDPQDLRFRCSCSKERMEKAIVQLGYDELQSILDEQAKISVDCQFCGQHYSFNQQDVNNLLPAEAAKAGHGKLH